MKTLNHVVNNADTELRKIFTDDQFQIPSPNLGIKIGLSASPPHVYEWKFTMHIRFVKQMLSSLTLESRKAIEPISRNKSYRIQNHQNHIYPFEKYWSSGSSCLFLSLFLSGLFISTFLAESHDGLFKGDVTVQDWEQSWHPRGGYRFPPHQGISLTLGVSFKINKERSFWFNRYCNDGIVKRIRNMNVIP